MEFEPLNPSNVCAGILHGSENAVAELFELKYDEDRITISARELHEFLEVGTQYKDWFPRMCEYGFTEGVDFNPLKIEQVRLEGNREVKRQIQDHQITIEMGKEIAMIQRSDKGKEAREYFIKLEKYWNTPEQVMARALQIANRTLASLQHRNTKLLETVSVQEQQITEMKPKASYYDIVLNCKDLISTSVIAKDYGKSAIWMNQYLHEKGIQFKQSGIWLLYQKYAECGYTSTKTHKYTDEFGEEHIKVHTYWTQKGRLFVYELLKGDGIIPLIEQ